MQKFVSSCVCAFFFFAHPVHSFTQSDDSAIIYGSYLVAMADEPVRSDNTVKKQPVFSKQTYTPKGTPETDCTTAVPATTQDFLFMQNVIIDFFNAMNHGNIKGLQAVCSKNAAFKTHLQDQYGNHHILDETVTSLIPFVAQAGNCFNLDMQFELLPPDISSLQFRTPYVCLVNNMVSHCGVCTFEFELADNTWKIKQMVDTRSRICK